MKNEPLTIAGAVSLIVVAVLSGLLDEYAPDFSYRTELLAAVPVVVMGSVRWLVDGPVTARAKQALIERLLEKEKA